MSATTALHQLLQGVFDLKYDVLCKKCNSRILIDNVFSTRYDLELYCTGCGKRFFLTSKNALGKRLLEINNEHLKSVSGGVNVVS